jgi:hypothetical protein
MLYGHVIVSQAGQHMRQTAVWWERALCQAPWCLVILLPILALRHTLVHTGACGSCAMPHTWWQHLPHSAIQASLGGQWCNWHKTMLAYSHKKMPCHRL